MTTDDSQDTTLSQAPQVSALREGQEREELWGIFQLHLFQAWLLSLLPATWCFLLVQACLEVGGGRRCMLIFNDL